MSTIPAPTFMHAREEWPDADFDIPDGELLHAPSDKDDADEDWDLEMDFGETAGAKAKAVVAGIAARSEAPRVSSSSAPQMFTIRPPVRQPETDDDDDEGVSTIKATGLPLNILPKIPKQPLQPTIDEDFEDGFALPSDLTKLSLAPVSLSKRGSKNSLEWGEKDNSSSSQSSDAYSSLGFADHYPSSTSASSASLPETETEDDEDELEGLVIPSALFESKQSGRQLNKILDSKKKVDPASKQIKVATPNPEDDFEAGLIIEDDVDLSPSRLLNNSNSKSKRTFNRSNSHPPSRPSTLRPPSRAAKLDRSKSPTGPPPSSTRQLQKIRLSPSPPLRPPSRSQGYQNFSAASPLPTPTPSPSSSFLSPKPGSLRGQKSHSGLKPPTPPSSTRQLTRKASLSVIESGSKQASRTSLEVPTNQQRPRYDEPTQASKAKSHKGSTSRLQDFKVPPTRPSTPSSNTAALRLTMPTQSRLKSRPALSQVFGPPPDHKPSHIPRATSPLPPLPPPPRPPSSMSLRASNRASKAVPPPPVPTPPPVSAPKLLRKPKRIRTYGDGTELDAMDDLPLDQDKEGRYRVQPKGYGNRIPGASYEKDKSLSRSGDKSSDNKGTIRKSKREHTLGHDLWPTPLVPATNTLRRTSSRLEFPPKPPPAIDVLPKKKKGTASPGATRRKPTLIRNLGGAGGPKVVGEMKWNPGTLRWEGNDQVLREFDAAIGTSTRPALITQLTGSTIGSPSGSFANGARVVGNMYFDPNQMRWISTLPPDEDEPDVFANLADDENDSDAWERKGDTIRASAQPSRISDVSSNTSTRSGATASSDSSHSRTISDSESERGSRASMLVADVDEAFVQKCRQAEERHRSEMKGWKTALGKYDPYHNPDRSHLYEIRALATRKY
ncbi:hypothetical protein FA15DRAFT_662829 [Coprinopsis marcescibilis]|uniref:Protein byr4 n=1 Tax=Coprinopsis marcescibilis TaxID=230819 RepID=A0A5C3LD75_COPMA|nr:hypothetical protein FA15DRAFT_662829 [Coprinopsis marcescibilis]